MCLQNCRQAYNRLSFWVWSRLVFFSFWSIDLKNFILQTVDLSEGMDVAKNTNSKNCIFMWCTNYELRVTSLQVAFIARVTCPELFLLHKLRVTFGIQVTSYCLLHELRVTFYLRVTSYCLFTSYELLLSEKFRVIVYCSRYVLLFIARVTSYCLLHELRVTVYCTSYKLVFVYGLQVTAYCTSYELLFTCELRIVINCSS